MMKKLISIFLLLFGIYILLWFGKKHWKQGYDIQYLVNTENQKFEVREQYQKKSDESQYILEIKINDMMFPFQIFSNEKKEKIVDAVYYYEDKQYQCIYPVWEFDANYDIVCQKDQVIYPYQSISGTDIKLDQFAKAMQEYGYQASQFIDAKNITKSINGISIYDNLIENHTIGFENYKGLYTLNKKNLLREKKLFENDIYQKSIHLFYDKYYIVANYDEKYEFHEFYIINKDTLKGTKIISNTAISLDSYIQGVVDNNIYLLDCSNKKQYRIHLNDKIVTKIGDVENGVQFYQYGKWETRTMYKALKEHNLFRNSQIPNEIDISEYDYFEVVGNYCYLYKLSDSGYLVYRILLTYPSVRYYITTITDFNKIQYLEDYIYWQEKDTIYYYHDSTGIRQVLQNPEFGFNEQLIFGIHEKKQ